MGITVAKIDSFAITHNFNQIKRLCNSQKTLAMIKGNAYGHGILNAMNAMPHADAYGVGNLDEAYPLLNAGVTKMIVVMRGFYNESELAEFLQFDQLVPVIHDASQVVLLQKFDLSKPQKVWLKIDTGMHRLGFLPKAVTDVIATLNHLGIKEKQICLFTHLADADNADSTDFTQQQLKIFQSITAHHPLCETSVFGSGGILCFREYHTNWIRPGCILYGLSPFAFDNPHYQKIKGFMQAQTLTSKLIAIKTVKAGDTIGYSCTFKAKKNMRIGVAGIGYADGYPRNAPTGTPVLVNGVRCKLVGRVSMDMITIDVSNLDHVNIGDEVVLWGGELSVNEVATYVGTIAHELACKLSSRVDVINLSSG